ncbi:GGDEF domain-containing protein [Nautilia sp.]
MLLTKRKKVGVSNHILVLLLAILGIMVFNVYLLINKSVLYNETCLLYKINQIKAAVQKYTKLKFIDKETEYLKNSIDNDINIVHELMLKKLEKNGTKHYVFYYKSILNSWKKIKNSKDKNEVLIYSEKNWRSINKLSSLLQKNYEYRNNEIMKKISFITIVITLLILVIILIVYFLIKHGLEKEKITDPLTKLYNRRFFIDNFHYFVELYDRYKRTFSIIFLDVDNFKKINDTFGHQKGDEVLTAIAKQIKSQLRKTDLAFRYGGEEIVVILPETELEKAYKIAERIRKIVKEKIIINSKPVTVSIGVGTYRGEGMFEFIEKVDSAVYTSKKAGKDRVSLSG